MLLGLSLSKACASHREPVDSRGYVFSMDSAVQEPQEPLRIPQALAAREAVTACPWGWRWDGV